MREWLLSMSDYNRFWLFVAGFVIACLIVYGILYLGYVVIRIIHYKKIAERQYLEKARARQQLMLINRQLDEQRWKEFQEEMKEHGLWV